MKKQILLIGKGGEYLIAKKNKEGNKLIPSSEKVYAREIVPYGFSFTFGSSFKDKNYGIYGYGHSYYGKEIDKGMIKTNEDYEKINLDRTIEGLEREVRDADADYILLDNLLSRDNSTYWDISGKAQLLVKR